MMENLDLADLKILQIIKDRAMKVSEVVNALHKQNIVNFSHWTIRKRLEKMVEKGIVEKGKVEIRVGKRRFLAVCYKLKKEYEKELDETIKLLLGN
jgi:predicted transcriptional regulator